MLFCWLHLHSVYMEGHTELDNDNHINILKLFDRPMLIVRFGFMRYKEKLAKGNKTSEKSHLSSEPRFWYHEKL